MEERFVKKQSIITLVFFLFAAPLFADAKLKDLVNIRGVRPNQLIGYGVVIGLAGTGDSKASSSTRESLASMMRGLGIKVDPAKVAMGNVATVVATAELPPFAQIGDKIDVRISVNGDAKSLAGGTLIQTPLRAGDGNTYAIAQGAVVIGQADGAGARVLTVARVPAGAYVEREFTPDYTFDGVLHLSLRKPDFTTNNRIVRAINSNFKGFYATALGPTIVNVSIPPHYQNELISFVSEVEQLKVEVDHKAKVVLNERTGTVVFGNEISINPVSISHGDLSIKIDKNAKDGSSQTVVPVKGVSVGDLVQVLNKIGVRPADLVGILQALYAAGALNGEMEFI